MDHLAPQLTGAGAQAIDGLDADVLTIENSRSGDEMLRALAKYGYSRDIGAGVYDVHSPVVPTCAALPAQCLLAAMLSACCMRSSHILQKACLTGQQSVRAAWVTR